MKTLLPYIVDKLKQAKAKYEVHSFDSGAVMIDMWIDNNLHVIQIDGNTIGLSLVTEETMLFDIIPDQLFRDELSFATVFGNIFSSNRLQKTIFINGNNFSTLEGFYAEIDSVLTKDLDWKTGHNFNAFSDLLRGGFGVHEYEEPIKLIWLHSDKSKADLGMKQHGERVYDILTNIVTAHPHIEFIEN